MVNNYFKNQSHLLDIECNFRYPDDCNAPGCRKADIVVDITLFDLIKLGRFLNTPVSHLFSEHCHLGLVTYKYNIRVIDKKHLGKKLRQSYPKSQNLSLRDYDNFLNKLLESYGFIESITEKISRLDTESETKNLFEKLSDRVIMEQLLEKMVRPVVVHRLESDEIKHLKRNLHPPAICFM